MYQQALSGVSFPLVQQMLVFTRINLQLWLKMMVQQAWYEWVSFRAHIQCVDLYFICVYMCILCSFLFSSLCVAHPQPTWCEWRCLSERRPPGTPSRPRARPRPGNCCTCPPRSRGGNPSWSQPAEAQRDELAMLQALSDTCFDLLCHWCWGKVLWWITSSLILMPAHKQNQYIYIKISVIVNTSGGRTNL